MTSLELIKDFIQEVTGPWSLVFGAAQLGKTLIEPNYGIIRFLINKVIISEDQSVVSFSNFNNTCSMDLVIESLVNPRITDSDQLIFDYYNAIVPSENPEEMVAWLMVIEKYNPLLEYGIKIK